MDLQISGKHVEVSEAVRSYVQRKLSKLLRHLPSLTEAKVEISAERTQSPQQRYVVQVTLNCGGSLLRGEERARDLFMAINKAVGVMDRQIERYKGRAYQRGRGPSAAKGMPEPSAQTEGEGVVVRVKRFAVKPMSPQEAAEQMELLGHSFYFFYNSATRTFNVLYRRQDGDYGLIEPEIT